MFSCSFWKNTYKRSHLTDFAVTDNNSINITKISSNSIETMPFKNPIYLKDIINQVRKINAMNKFPINQRNSQRHHQYFLPHNEICLVRPKKTDNIIDAEEWKPGTTLPSRHRT